MSKPMLFFVVALLFFATVVPAQSRQNRREREPDVRIKDQKFSPAEIKVKAGASVKWLNEDERDHQIIAADKSFKSGNLGNGDSHEHKFSKTGKHAYQCAYHPRERGTVVVEEER